MSPELQNLISLIELEKIEEGIFRGQSEDLGLPQVFGGQVVGQAMYAAKQTIPEERLILFIVIFYVQAIAHVLLFMTLKFYAMAEVLAHVE